MENTNPLLDDLRLPGTTIRLPSRGLFYKNGELHPAVTDGEIYIHPMTVVDEITMKSIDKLFSGDAVTEVLLRCAPQILKPRQLLSKDIDFLLIQLRKVSYGDSIEIKYTHDCAPDPKSHSYIILCSSMKSKDVDPSKFIANSSVTLPNGQVVSMTTPRFDDLIKIIQANNEDLTVEQRTKREVDVISSVVNGVTVTSNSTITVSDKHRIVEWVRVIPREWVAMITEKISALSEWGVEPTMTIKCKDCGADIVIPVPTNPLSFFS